MARPEHGRVLGERPGRLDPRVQAILGSVPTSINVVESIGWTETDIVTATQAAHYAVWAQDDVLDASTGADPLTGEIEVQVALASAQQTGTQTATDPYISDLTEIAESGLAQASGLSEHFAVRVEGGLPVEGSGYDWLRGGSSLRTCTAGFSVRNPLFSNGILTADHCPENQDVGTNDLTWRGRVPSATGDVEWYSNNQTTYANFYASANTIRGVTGSANPVDGNTYCRYGKTTGQQCDSVYMLNRCRGSYCGLVMMFNREAASGDSGGPWFSGHVAVGIHSGGVTYLLIARDVWSPIRPALNALGVTLKMS